MRRENPAISIERDVAKSLRLNLLGGIQVGEEADPAVLATGTKATLLLAYLALKPGKAHSRETLMGLLWSDRGDSQARASLRQALWSLGQALKDISPCPLVIDGERISLDAAAVEMDVATFERLLKDGAPDALQKAIALYQGELLQGVKVRDPSFEDFVAGERARFHALAVDACSKLLDHQVKAGLTNQAIATAKRLLEIDPLQEAAHRALMQQFAKMGQVALAIKQYECCRDIFRRELDVEPGAETKSLLERIRLARPGAEEVGARREQPGEEQQLRGTPAGASLQEKPSIAVLPFVNFSGDPEQEYFADGMVEDIITGLSRIKWLFVIARNTTFTYKGRAVDVKQVGRDLSVRYVLEGSVRKAADRVRVAGQLIDCATGAHVWTERFDRKFDDIFALQDDITLSVVGAIEPSLRLAEVEHVKRKRSDSLDAYDLVLQAQADVVSRSPERAKKALLLLERAIALDPNYALAHAYAAECYHTLFLRGGLLEENRAASIRHAEIAIANGQDDASALAFAGFVIGMDKHDRAAAFAAFEAALAISPSSALTYIVGSVVLAWGGEAERAIEWADRGLRLSPFDPSRASAFLASSLGQFHLGQFEAAAAAARKAIQANPRFSMCHMALSAALVKIGRPEEAKAVAARVLELQPTFRCSHVLAAAGCVPGLSTTLSEALREAGLPD